MAGERIQRRIERLLDRIDIADASGDWQQVVDLSQDVLAIDEENREALAYQQAAERQLGIPSDVQSGSPPSATAAPQSTRPGLEPSADLPTSFADGRYQVKKLLGEGGKKKVYLAYDGKLDRDVALAFIKTEGLDETSRSRVNREARDMGRLGDHPHIQPIHDFGDEDGQPYMVQPFMLGDVEGLIPHISQMSPVGVS